MAIRTRTLRYNPGDGSFYMTRRGLTPPISATRSESYANVSTCTDTANSWNSGWSVTHVACEGHRIHHHYVYNYDKPSEYCTLKGYPLGFFTDTKGIPSHLVIPDQPSDTYLAVQLLAATNPSKPLIDLPVSLLELRELPSMLKTAGDSLIKKYAKQNLNREFGMVPLVNDYLSLLKYREAMDHRMALFKSLREKPQLRKASLFSSGASSAPGTLIQSNTAPSYCTVRHVLERVTTQTKVWGYVEWTPSPPFNEYNPLYNDEMLYNRARNALLGTQIGLVTLWNAIPWTWLIDWFGNIGSWLEANRTVIPVTPSTPRICQTTTTEAYYTASSSNNVGMKPGTFPILQTRVTKERRLASATLPSANLPLFTKRQVDIIASLAILRKK